MGKDWGKTGYEGYDRTENLKAIAALGSHVKALLYKVDERQNFTDEVFTSVLNQGSDMVSAFAVMYGVNDGCFYASMTVLGINAAVRLVIGLATYCSEDVVTKSTCKVVAGLGWGMIEPVSGNAILASGLESIEHDIYDYAAIGGTTAARDRAAARNERADAEGEHDALVQKLKTRMRVEFTMAILEDLPELVIDVVFAASLDGDEALSFADIALLVFGAVLSLYHIAKCIWTYITFRSILREVKGMTAEQALASVVTDAEEKYGF